MANFAKRRVTRHSRSQHRAHLVLSELVADFAGVLAAVGAGQAADGEGVDVAVVLHRVVAAVHRDFLAVLVPGVGVGRLDGTEWGGEGGERDERRQ